MRETKTKKRRFSLFLIPLVLLSAALLGNANAHAATAPIDNDGGATCSNLQTAYYYNGTGANASIVVTQVGTQAGANNTTATCYGASDTFTYNTVTNSFLKQGCGGLINGAAMSPAKYPVAAKFTGNPCTPGLETDGAISVAQNQAAAVKAAAAPDTADTAGTGTTTCAVPGGFGYVICPAGNLFASIGDGLYGWISQTFLATNTDIVSTNSGTYSAWQVVLGIANVIFVIIFLLIIFSQATGYGITNYGIKKMLPKIIIGAILINLSFFFCQVAVDASNLLGYGIATFLKVSANQSSNWGTLMNEILVTQFTGGVLAAGAAVAVITPIIALNMGLGLSAVLLCVVILLFIVLFLIVRQVLIIMCVVLAPVAFAAWLLPNTEKFFKRWWKIFYAMLIVFPLASLVVGSADLASTIIANSWLPSTSQKAGMVK